MKKLRSFAAAALLVGAVGHIGAQEAAAPAEDEDVIVLSPFEVTAENNGYAAATTLAGNRLNTELRDIGNAVTVITSQFLKDIGATDNKTLLQYTTNTEVGGFYGNFGGFGDGAHLDESGRFTNPNSNTRIRGLTSADNTREYFLTDIPWEGYNIDGVDLQRGPNSILFGQGSPAGIINVRTKSANFKDSNEVSFRVGSFGSTRATLDVNKVLLKNELAVRIAAVRNDEEYKQDPAYAEQKRIYGAVRWEPNFLKNGSARTIIKASIEFGDIDSNNPRQLPPNDRITPWFYTGTYQGKNIFDQDFAFPQLNKLTVNPAQNEDDNTGRPNNGYDRPNHNGPSGLYLGYLIPKYANDPNFSSGKFNGSPNEYYQPWIAGSMLGVFGSPAFNFTDSNATQGVAVDWEPSGQHGLNSSGGPIADNTGVGVRYMRPASIASYSSWASNSRQLYGNLQAWAYGLFKDRSLTDSSVFDFYNQLFDGDTKWEWQNFRNLNASLAQTFFHDRAGFEVTYNKEHYKSGKVQLLTDDSLNIDINRVYSDGSPTGLNGMPWEDGTPNPNLGKPYVGGSGNGGNNQSITDRTDWRITGFVDYDFNQNHANWFTKLMGRHVITGLVSGDKTEIANQDFARYSIDDPAYAAKMNGQGDDDPKLSWTNLTPFTFIYLGPSLSSASTASGAYIPNPSVAPSLVSGKVVNFDATWNATGVNPGDPWHDDYYPLQGQVPFTTDGLYRDTNGVPIAAGSEVGWSTQNFNPANYVGFREYPINIIDSLTSEENMWSNTTNYSLRKTTLRSSAFNWQAHFWDNAIVATWGVRKDTARAWQRSRVPADVTADDPSNSNYARLDHPPTLPHTADNQLEVTSHAWTAVVHLNQLPGFKKLPINVSVFYNHSTDFQPAAQRVDIYGESLAAPSGKTKDVGILLETQDGKYSLKVNKYNTSSVGATSAGLQNAWFIGASQAWSGDWVNKFEFNWTSSNAGGHADPNDPTYETNTQYNYEASGSETAAQAKARELSVIANWRAWQASVDPRFYAAWAFNPYSTTGQGANAYTYPNGLAITEDSSSQGYEIEFNATPTRNWRITLNASKTTAQRSNIGGENLQAFVAAYSAFLGTGAVAVPGSGGDLRIWWGGAGNDTALKQWNSTFKSEYNQRVLQEGTDVPELRKWRWNAITNYQFDHGPLKNFNIGGGIRYESSVVIGFEPIAGANAGEISFDLVNPYRGPSDTNYDAWVGYRRKIWRNIDWNVQLNVRNIGVGDELVPITTQPDGTPATYRIRAPQTWAITNTFNF